MFNFFKRRAYRRLVLNHLHSLLWFYPGGRKNIVKDNPGTFAAIRNDVRAAPQAAMLVATSILTKAAETLTDEQRGMILNQLRTLDPEYFRKIALSFMEKKEGATIPDGIALGTLLYGTALILGHGMLCDKEIEEGNFDTFRSEVMRALEGKPAGERSSTRLDGFF